MQSDKIFVNGYGSGPELTIHRPKILSNKKVLKISIGPSSSVFFDNPKIIEKFLEIAELVEQEEK